MPERSVVVRFRAEVADFRKQLKGTEQALGDVAKKAGETARSSSTALGQMVQSARRHEDAWNRVGGTLTGIGAAAAAGVGIAVAKFAEFDEAMSGVEAASHETAGNLDLLREAAKRAGADTKFSASEAAAGITNLIKAGVDVTDVLSGGLTGALDLAAAGELQVADAAEYTATTLTQFKLSGDKATHVADVLAAGAGKAQGEVSDMAEAMKYAGVPASQLGVSLEETAGTVALFASNGIIGEQAGTSLRGMLSSLTSPSKDAAEVMKDLNLQVFDGQGKFLGLAGVADQLTKATWGMTDAEKANALGKLFGNAQLTAANVLLAEGGDAVREWTDKVNDAGYAAETARLMTDNLNGDIERLGGALDTALIQTGEAANGVLRTMVQTLTAAVDAYGSADPMVQRLALGVGVLTAAVGLAAGGFLLMAPRIVATKAAMDVLAASMPKTVAAVRAVGSAMTGPLGVGLAAATIAFGVFVKHQADAKQRVDDLKSSLDAQTGAITTNTRAVAYKQLVDEGTIDYAKRLGLSLDVVTDAALGNEEAMDELRAAAERVQVKIDNLTESEGYNGEQTKAARKERAFMGHVLEDTATQTDKVRKAQAAWNDEQAAGIGVTKDHADATDGAKSALLEYADATDDGTASVSQFVKALDDLIDGMKEHAGIALTAREAQRQYRQAVDDARDALTENGKTLDLNTEAGRKNQAALDDLAKSGWDLIDANKEQGATQDELRKTMRQLRDDFIKQAESMGMSKDAATALADQLDLIPDRVNVQIAADTARASESVRRLIENLNGRVATIRVRATLPDLNGLASGSGRPGLATGGQVVGPGTGTSDDVPIWASNGEFVVRAAAVRKYGVDFFHLLNAGRFATGGPVGHYAASSTPSTGRVGGGVQITVGNIQAVNPDAAARALVTRTRDAIAVTGLAGIGGAV